MSANTFLNLNIQVNPETPCKQRLESPDTKDGFSTPTNQSTMKSQRFTELINTPYIQRSQKFRVNLAKKLEKEISSQTTFQTQKKQKRNNRIQLEGESEDENENQNYFNNRKFRSLLDNRPTEFMPKNQLNITGFLKETLKEPQQLSQTPPEIEKDFVPNNVSSTPAKISKKIEDDIQDLKEMFQQSQKKLQQAKKRYYLKQEDQNQNSKNNYIQTFYQFFEFYNTKNTNIMSLFENNAIFEIVGQDQHDLRKTFFALSTSIDGFYLDQNLDYQQQNDNQVIISEAGNLTLTQNHQFGNNPCNSFKISMKITQIQNYYTISHVKLQLTNNNNNY